MKEENNMRVLSIDAWNHGNEENEYCWEWNNWFHVGDIDKETFELLETDAEFIQWFIDEGYVLERYKNELYIEDNDEYNVVICWKETSEPLFAIEYGKHY